MLVSVMFASASLAVPDDNNSSVSVVESDWEGEVTLTIPISILGDADDNGKLDVNDIVMIVNYMMGKNPEGFVFSLADVNSDNVINDADVVMIALMLLK